MARSVGEVFILLAGVCWGTAGVLGKLIMSLGFSPITVVAYRLCLGFTALMLMALPRKDVRLLMSVDAKSLAMLALAGVVGVGLGMLMYFWAVNLVGASLAVILLYTAPMFTLAIAKPLLHEKISKVKVASILIAFLGCYLAVKGYDAAYIKLNAMGILIGVLSGLFYSVYIVISKKVMSRGTSAFTVMLLAMGFGALATLAFEMATGPREVVFTPYSATLIVLLAIIPTALANMLFIMGLNLTEAGRANVYSTVEVVAAIALASAILGEKLDLLQVLGCSAVITGIALLYSSK